jgi:heptosyltransferase-3
VPTVYDIRDKSPRILVIRRDNIGDLVCTTPLIHALRQRFPGGWIGAMVNSYNAPVLAGNTDLDDVSVYTKAKHRDHNQSLVGIFWDRLKMMNRLRKLGLDDVIIATTAPQPRVVRLARWLKPKRIIAFGACGADLELPLATGPIHEVEDVFRVARLYGIESRPAPCRIFTVGALHETNRIAVHISARKPSQRWPAERFVELMSRLHAEDDSLRFVLLWSPGASDNPLHPGDDAKAAAIIDGLGNDFPIEPTTTSTLPALIAALARCSLMICADGGAMHIGAGLGLPIVALFGKSSPDRWRPWSVPQRVLQMPSRDVADITVVVVMTAINELRAGIPASTS